MSLKPIVLHGHSGGPNPWKVVMILEKLGLPYEQKPVPFSEIKQEPFISLNPNGRLPAIQDPNTGITLWESGAILEYLVETYDKDHHKISFPAGSREYFEAKQWLHFQMSGQGPYFGQAVWFTVYHPEKLPSAQERYFNEVRRVSGVLDGFLGGREYLVGDRFSYVDAAFVPWFGVILKIMADSLSLEKDFPRLNAWLDRLHARPSIAKAAAKREEAMATATKG